MGRSLGPNCGGILLQTAASLRHLVRPVLSVSTAPFPFQRTCIAASGASMPNYASFAGQRCRAREGSVKIRSCLVVGSASALNRGLLSASHQRSSRGENKSTQDGRLFPWLLGQTSIGSCMLELTDFLWSHLRGRGSNAMQGRPRQNLRRHL